MLQVNIRVLQYSTVIAGVYFLLASVGNAQEGWNLQLEPMYMEVGGANTHQANITTTTYNFNSYSPLTSSVTQSTNFNLGGNGTFRGQFEYMPEDWGIGISGWWFDTSGSLSQNYPSPAIPASNSYTVSSIAYTSNTLSPYIPSSNSGSVLKTSANSTLSVWSLDAYGMTSLGNFESSRINMTFGVKFGGLTNSSSETYNATPATNVSYGYYTDTTSSSGIGTTSANANFLVGPAIGFQGMGKFGNHRLEGFLNQSVLIGNVSRKSASLYQVSDQYSSNYAYYSYSYQYSYPYSAQFSNSETKAIPVTEMKIKYMYDVTENLSLGLGVFASVWVDAPTYSATQSNDTKTLVFYGGLASVGLKY